MRANHCGWHLLPEVLERLGYAVPVAAGPESGRRWSLRDIKNAVPPGLRRWIADHLPSRLRDKINVAVEGAGLDWSETRAFTLPTDLEGYIRINLKGREPEGVVAPGQEYRTFAAKSPHGSESFRTRPAAARPFAKRGCATRCFRARPRNTCPT